jgi:hypothetical protein
MKAQEQERQPPPREKRTDSLGNMGLFSEDLVYGNPRLIPRNSASDLDTESESPYGRSTWRYNRLFLANTRSCLI